jgi:hypothetical protein
MANITDPRVIKLTNEQVRPLAEQARAMRARIDSLTTDWFGGLNTLVPNTTDLVADGRDAEGASRLTGADVNSLVGNLIAAHDALNAQIIAKPCVRPLSVTVTGG